MRVFLCIFTALFLANCKSSINIEALINKDGKFFKFDEENAFSGRGFYLHRNGKKAYECEFKDGVKHGNYSSWYASGEKEKQGYYHNNKKDGLWVNYYKNGNKESEGRYLLGLKDSEWKVWFVTGSLKEHLTYSKGKIKGLYKSFYDSGNLEYKAFYINDYIDLNENSYRYYNTGIVQEEIAPVGNGFKIKKWYNNNMLAREISFYSRNEKVEISSSGFYTNTHSSLIEKDIEWYQNGLLKSESFFDERGNRDGIWTLYDEKNDLKQLIIWHKGLLIEKSKVPANDISTTNSVAYSNKLTVRGSNGNGGNGADRYERGGNEGIAGGNGDQGRPGGDPNSRNYTGSPRNLGVRVVNIPAQSFEDDFNESGKIALEIVVDANGRLTSTSYQARGSSLPKSSKQFSIAQRRAAEIKYPKYDGGFKQTLTFNFNVN